MSDTELSSSEKDGNLLRSEGENFHSKAEEKQARAVVHAQSPSSQEAEGERL